MPVSARYTNPPLDDLERRDEHLLSLINALHSGEALFAREVPLAAGTQVGQLVYYDAAARCYKPAVAALSATGDKVAASSYAAGILAVLHTATVGTLITAGRVPLSSPSFVDNPGVTGLRYVSPVAGRLADVSPALRLPVGMWQAEERTFMFHPASAALVEGHVHYRFELTASPAGVVSDTYLEPHVFSSSDATLPGWLPANHPSFGGLAPVGAKFGYNIAQHPELMAVFPPAPIDGAVVEVYLDGAGSTRATGDLVQITATGIWWMRDDWGWSPWQMSANAFIAEPESPDDPADPARPPPVELQYGQGYVGTGTVCPTRVFLWFTRPTFFTEDSSVQSLTAAEGTPYRITDCAGNPASTGNLVLDFDLASVQEPDTEDIGQALSRIDGNTFKYLPSVTRVSSKTSAIRVTGSRALPDGTYAGAIELDFADPSRSREIPAALFALEHARQDQFQNLFYMALPAAMTSAVRGRIDVPSYFGASEVAVNFEFEVFVTLPGTLPNLTVTYRRMRQPAARSVLTAPNNNAEVALETLSLAGQIDGGVTRPNVYFNAVTTTFPAAAGDTIYFTVRRNQDTYTGDVGIIKAKAVIA